MSNFTNFILTLVVLNSCGKMDVKYPIRLTNNSSHSIGLYFATGGQFGNTYPDTILPLSDNYVVRDVKKGDSYRYDSGISWEKIFEQDLPRDTLSIYVFHSDTLNNNSWTIIRTQNKYLKRFDLSLQDLKDRNYNISYP
jgi:hypothetical protein